MSLWPVQTVAPCMSYVDYGLCFEGTPPPSGPFGPYGYGPDMVTCPRHYKESTNSVSHFFYEPSEDRLIVFIMLRICGWPSWVVKRYEFDAATGELIAATFGTSIGVWGIAYTQAATMGSYGKLYAARNSETAIREVSPLTGGVVAGGWTVDPYKNWTNGGIYTNVLVNRIDNLLAAVWSRTLECWRNINTTPELFASLRLPNGMGYLAWESGKYCWIITKDGVILKADYTIPRWEMISTVQNPEEDSVNYCITFDTKRHRVVVFRQRPDAADGACRHQLEFYYPMVKPATLTQPVPVTSLRGGKRITLVANLIGDAGEGLTPYTVTGELVAPVEGTLVTPFSATGLNGAAGFQYQAPAIACTETLQLAVTVEES